MSDEVNQSLQKIAKGTGIVFIGTILGLFFQFVGRVLVARFFTQSEYGIFSLAFVVLNIAVIVSTLGLKEGATRQIAYYRGKSEFSNVQEVVFSSLKLTLIASLILTVLLFSSSDIISVRVFHESGLAPALRIISIAIPFLALIHVLTSVFRGFDEIKPRVYFENILRSSLFPLFLVPVIILNLTFQKAIYAFLGSFVVSCVLFLIYTLRKAPFHIKFSVKIEVQNKINNIEKELLLFSLPLLGASILNMIMNWTDTLMLGYFKTADIVGLYNGPMPLARLIPVALMSAGFIYVPIVSGIYSKGLMEEMKRTYQILTKWIFLGTIPLFFLLFLFPETVLGFLFGKDYIQATPVLRILTLGFMFHVFLGLNGLSLVVAGKTRFLMWTSLAGGLSNVILNAALIPTLGIIGAAIASLLSYSLVNILNSTRLYQLVRVHPFTGSYVKPVGVALVLIGFIYVLTYSHAVKVWMLPPLLVVFLLSYFILLLLMRCFDKEDIEVLLAIEKKLGVDVTLIKRVLRKFV